MRENLTKKQSEAIAALIQNRTMRDAAKAVGVGEATLFRWLRDQNFRDAYLTAKSQVVEQAISNLQNASGEAVDTLRQVMNDSNSPVSSKVTSARVILEISLRAVEIQHLIRRLDRLEATINK